MIHFKINQVLSCALLIVLFTRIPKIKADASDDECGIFVEKEISSVANSTDKLPNDSLASAETNYYKKRIPKKSLLIIFDGTNSMHVDLEQLREAAKEIATSLHARKDKPIKNYVLTVFKDPRM